VKPWLDVDGVTLFHGDCIEVMRSLPDNSVDAVVTDPPYGIGFMGKAWDGAAIAAAAKKQPMDHTKTRERSASMHAGSYDLSLTGNTAYQVWFTDVATEALRVLKPGGHLLAFGGTRTWHRLAVAIEDAGFEVRDSVAWMYGSGFPKSLDVSKAIDKRAGAKREVVGERTFGKTSTGQSSGWNTNNAAAAGRQDITAPATPAAEQWAGFGTALKPAHEPIVVARKPLIGTVAENVLTHGTGALNIDGCRIAADSGRPLILSKSEDSTGILGNGLNGSEHGGSTTQGRWPANVILDESQAAELDKQSGVSVTRPSSGTTDKTMRNAMAGGAMYSAPTALNDSGGASRFFYVAKASKKERPNVNGIAHPTVKPMTLMRYLVRLVTPPGGTVLEPFAGSGTTIEACVIEGFNCIAIEREADYLPLIEARLNRPIQAAL
jgi:DNA modification methylase